MSSSIVGQPGKPKRAWQQLPDSGRHREEAAKPTCWFLFAEPPSSDRWATESTPNEGEYSEHNENEEQDFRAFERQARHHAEAEEGGEDGDYQKHQSQAQHVAVLQFLNDGATMIDKPSGAYGVPFILGFRTPERAAGLIPAVSGWRVPGRRA